ncbi:hypothetical protein L6164_027753 [Bauhinia variegata]|uniref:Uncharacterized protein n=1 Tax=Bauhinia variegata TaxID=167791 RepID=A0ACB9LTY5_BAUVA|nr:hypothetical protein L6164_027753 [Bauhinia variegata]
MRFFPLIPVLAFAIFCSFPLILGQQPYIGLGTTACPRRGNPHSIRGYTCNGVNRSCQAYLTFRSQPIYNSVNTISALLGAEPSKLAEINQVSRNATFETNRLVIVPVNCSCAGEYYQSNTSYVVQNADTLFLIANNTFEGLSTCQALENQNELPRGDLFSGTRLAIPLRCACPTINQTEKGVKYLLSYLVTWDDSVSVISERFGVYTNSTLDANTLSYTSTIYPFTTILVPLQGPPSISGTAEPPPSPSPPSTPFSPSGGNSNKTWVYVVIGVVGGIALISSLAAIIFCRVYSKDKKKDVPVIVSQSQSQSQSFEAIEKPKGKILLDGESEELSEILSSIGKSLKVYSFKELRKATEDFSPSFWIKGSVYRGVINGDLAAIKKTEGDVSKEIELLNKVNHSNVIRLSGVSFNKGHWYLVYEYSANGSLSDWIYSSNIDDKFLNWAQRMQIALDVATGLDYLHSFTCPPYIHKDLKSNNILLDSYFRAKISNFSLARSVEGEEDQFPMTRHIIGTKGYMAPEYLEHGVVSTKLDVYAFGILMMEMLTGKEVAAFYTEEKVNLSDFLSAILDEESDQERLGDFMDPSLHGNYPTELVKFVVRLILNCIDKDPVNRPALHEILTFLSRTLESSLTWETSMNISANQSLCSRSS